MAFFRLCVVACVVTSCATESAPTGGKEDQEPPQVKEATPPNKTVNFSARQIEIRFNEFIQPSAFPQTLISPPLPQRPDFKIRGKSIIIKLKSDLQPATTYTINFGDEVKDLNASNVLSNFTYVFSTGPYIDSQKISGRVLLAKDESEAEGVIVGLYQSDKPNPILTDKPIYFSKTSKTGSFSIENIKAGRYQVLALKDQNLNFIYDQPNELIGFSDTLVNLNDTLPKNIQLRIFQETGKRAKLVSSKSIEPGKIRLTYNAPIESIKLDAAVFNKGYQAWSNAGKDTLTVWFSNYYIKRDTIYTTVNDSLFDTLRMELKTYPQDSVTKLAKYKLSIQNQSVSEGKNALKTQQTPVQSLYGWLKFPLTRPVVQINDSKAPQLLEDTIQKPIDVQFRLDEKTKQTLEINAQRKQSTAYKLIIPDSFMLDLFGLWNQRMEVPFTTNTSDAIGNIKLKITIADIQKHYVLRLYNSASDIVQEYFCSGEKERTENILHVPSGTYRIGVIEDTNQNGEWDTGRLEQRQQPERVINFKDTYTLKGGWDLDIEVKF